MSIQQSIPSLKTQPSFSATFSALAAQGFVPKRLTFEPRPISVPHSKPTDAHISFDSEDEYADSTSEDEYSDIDEMEDERKIMYSFQVGAGEFYLYQSRYYTFDEARKVFYALLHKTKDAEPTKAAWEKEEVHLLNWVVINYGSEKNMKPKEFIKADWEKVSRLVPGRSYRDCISTYEAFLRIPSDKKFENQDVADEFKAAPKKAESIKALQFGTVKENQELVEGKRKEEVGGKESVGQLISFNSRVSTKGCIK